MIMSAYPTTVWCLGSKHSRATNNYTTSSDAQLLVVCPTPAKSCPWLQVTSFIFAVAFAILVDLHDFIGSYFSCVIAKGIFDLCTFRLLESFP